VTHDLSVVKIKVLNMIGRMSELEKAVNILGMSSVFHPDNVLSFYSDTSGFSPIAEENPYGEALRHMTDTLKSIEKRTPSFDVKSIEKISGSIGDWKTYAEKTADSFSKLLEQRSASHQAIGRYKREKEKIGHFFGLDMNLTELRECRFIKFRFGFLPKESMEKLEEIKENPYVVFFPSTSDVTGDWGMYCAPIDKIDEVDKIFSGLYFERTRFTELSGTPEQDVADLEKKCEEERANIQKFTEQIDDLWKKEESHFRDVYSWLSEKFTCYGIRRYAARYRDNFILTGWIPADKEKAMREQLDRLNSIKFTLDDGSDPDVLIHSPPVKLKNKKLFRPFEFFIEIYGMPAYDEMDPTSLVALSYVLLYGIMFADLGQGICISLVGLFMWKKMKMALG
jgi:V/A-type H+/Na+-transporting ATPase subunit I